MRDDYTCVFEWKGAIHVLLQIYFFVVIWHPDRKTVRKIVLEELIELLFVVIKNSGGKVAMPIRINSEHAGNGC